MQVDYLIQIYCDSIIPVKTAIPDSLIMKIFVSLKKFVEKMKRFNSDQITFLMFNINKIFPQGY